MNCFQKSTVCFVSFFITGYCLAQTETFPIQAVSDVEPKAYGAYAGGKIDTVDLATGNLYLHIPLVSYPQVGRLPPLTFSIGLNNAPYSIEGACTSSNNCLFTPYRLDPTPPGNISLPGNLAGSLSNAKLGAYIESSFEGGIVQGQLSISVSGNGDSGITYSLTDENGGTHQLASDLTSWNTYRAIDGSGYSFVTSVQAGSFLSGDNAYDSGLMSNIGLGSAPYGTHNYTHSWDYWMGGNGTSGLRLGTVYSPTGIQFTNSFVSPSGLPNLTRLLTTVESDGSNSVTRTPWYWSNAAQYHGVRATDINTFYNSTNTNFPTYVDSVQRTIPDIISLSETVPAIGAASSTCPAIPNQPTASASLTWSIPGPGGSNLQYLICYVHLYIEYDWADYGQAMTPQSQGPIWQEGYAIQSVVLPDDQSYWGFVYDQTTPAANCSYDPIHITRCGSGDLLEVMLPTGGTISYTYGNIGSSPSNPSQTQRRCVNGFTDGTGGGECHVVLTRTERDGVSSPSLTVYQYGAGPASGGFPPTTYTTTETTPACNDIQHTFTALSYQSSVITDQLSEIETDYYQGSATSGCLHISNCLRSVLTQYNNNQNPPWNIPAVTNSTAGSVNGGTGKPSNFMGAIPTSVTTNDVASGSSTQTINQYSTLFTAIGLSCSTSHTCQSVDAVYPDVHGWNTDHYPYPISINFIAPTQQDTYGPGGWLHTAQTTYEFMNTPTATAPALPASSSNTDHAGSNIYSKTVYGYDGMWNRQTVSQLNSANANQMLTTSTASFNAQNVPYQIQDADGYKTYVSTFQCAGLYPRTVVSAYQSPSTLSETSQYSYDCNTGSMTGAADANGSQTEYVYTSDPLGRLTSVLHGTGTNTSSVGNSFVDSPATTLTAAGLEYTGLTSVTSTVDETVLHDKQIQSTSLYDGLGRLIQQANPAGYSVTTSYNASGQVASVTNPHGSTQAPTTDGTTFYYYDPLGRVVLQVEADQSNVWKCYDGLQDAINPQPHCSALAHPSANPWVTAPVSWVDVTDESDNHHQEVSNGLGQLISVIEPDPQSGILSLETDYEYDSNGNLHKVTQLGATGETARVRTFTYDSLSRLLWSHNPESGVICYGHGDGTESGCQKDGYDPNGNLLYKTDARGVTTSYTYDGLNRLLTKTYSSNDPSGAPSSCYQYDNAGTAFGIGRLASQWTQKGACSSSPPAGAPTLTSISAYDFMGRVQTEQQCVFGNCSTNYGGTTYSYDLAGDLTSFGDGRGVMQFNKQYDTATRLQTVTTIPSNFTLFSAQSYSPAGGLTSASYGMGSQTSAPLNQTRAYDPRLRITSETDGVSQ